MELGRVVGLGEFEGRTRIPLQTMSDRDRRNFKRIQAPVFWRPEGILSRLRSAVDVSLGGIRIYSDEPHDVGDRLALDLLMPDGTWVVFVAEVVWVDAIGFPGKFDVGLRFVSLHPDAREKLRALLDKSDD